MQAGKSVIRLRSGGPPLEVNNTIQKATDSKTGVFSVERCITYKVGKRVLSLTITEWGCAGRVNTVLLKLSEENGKGSWANFDLRFIRDNRYGVLYYINSTLVGSYDSVKENYCVPPLPDTELILYACREIGLGGCLSVAKKKDNTGMVEKVKFTHAFGIDDELTYNVSIKITNTKRVGLNVEVEGPMKLTMDYTNQLISTSREKMESQMEATMRQHGNHSDSDDGNMHEMNVLSIKLPKYTD